MDFTTTETVHTLTQPSAIRLESAEDIVFSQATILYINSEGGEELVTILTGTDPEVEVPPGDYKIILKESECENVAINIIERGAVEVTNDCTNPIGVEICSPIQVDTERSALGCTTDTEGEITGRVFVTTIYDEDGVPIGDELVHVALDGTITRPYTGEWGLCEKQEPCETFTAIACDNLNDPDPGNWLQDVTRLTKFCPGEPLGVEYFVPDPEDPTALIEYTLVGEFVYCDSGVSVEPPAVPCQSPVHIGFIKRIDIGLSTPGVSTEFWAASSQGGNAAPHGNVSDIFTDFNTHVNGAPDSIGVQVNWSIIDTDIDGAFDGNAQDQWIAWSWVYIPEDGMLADANTHATERGALWIDDVLVYERTTDTGVSDRYIFPPTPITKGIHKIGVQVADFSFYSGVYLTLDGELVEHACVDPPTITCFPVVYCPDSGTFMNPETGEPVVVDPDLDTWCDSCCTEEVACTPVNLGTVYKQGFLTLGPGNGAVGPSALSNVNIGVSGSGYLTFTTSSAVSPIAPQKYEDFRLALVDFYSAVFPNATVEVVDTDGYALYLTTISGDTTPDWDATTNSVWIDSINKVGIPDGDASSWIHMLSTGATFEYSLPPFPLVKCGDEYTNGITGEVVDPAEYETYCCEEEQCPYSSVVLKGRDVFTEITGFSASAFELIPTITDIMFSYGWGSPIFHMYPTGVNTAAEIIEVLEVGFRFADSVQVNFTGFVADGPAIPLEITVTGDPTFDYDAMASAIGLPIPFDVIGNGQRIPQYFSFNDNFEWPIFLDIQEAIVPVLQHIATNCDGSRTVTYTEADGVTEYTLQGEYLCRDDIIVMEHYLCLGGVKTPVWVQMDKNTLDILSVKNTLDMTTVNPLFYANGFLDPCAEC